jgi:hypothetical protein
MPCDGVLYLATTGMQHCSRNDASCTPPLTTAATHPHARIALARRSPKQQTPFASMLDHTATIPAGMASRAESFVLYPPSNWIVDSGAFNWLIVGTDAHAKNYALFIGVQSRARLAPLYDVASILPYTQIDIKKTKLSIKLDGEYRFSNIQAATGARWPRTSDSIRIRLSSARTNMLANCRITSQTLNAK